MSVSYSMWFFTQHFIKETFCNALVVATNHLTRELSCCKNSVKLQLFNGC